MFGPRHNQESVPRAILDDVGIELRSIALSALSRLGVLVAGRAWLGLAIAIASDRLGKGLIFCGGGNLSARFLPLSRSRS
jgi:hypothetical protein